MAEAATIARPYAKAAFLVARDAKALAAWSQALAGAAALVADAKAAARLADPALSVAELQAAFAGLGGASIDAPWANFVGLLAENKRLALLPQIAAQYAQLKHAYENEIDVEVTAATALDETQSAKLAASLERRFGRRVRLSTRIDPDLLGGAVIRAGDQVIDGSIRGRLTRLAVELGS